MKILDAAAVIQALATFIIQNKPFDGHSYVKHCKEIHANAGTVFKSEEFQTWMACNRIKPGIAAPGHQEMNGLPKQMWQSACVTCFLMCAEARLGWAFVHHSLMYAARVMGNVAH